MNDNTELRARVLDAAVELMGRSGRNGFVRVQGTSMHPMLRPDQELAVDFGASDLRRGDLLLYRQLDYLVVHRLVGWFPRDSGPRFLKTRGDGRVDIDPPLDPQRFVGRVTAVRDGDGWWRLRGRRARLYAGCLAWHDLTWAGLVSLAGMGDRGFKKLGLKTPFLGITARIDRGLLRLAHALLFRHLHRRTASPPGEPLAGSETDDGDRLLY